MSVVFLRSNEHDWRSVHQGCCQGTLPSPISSCMASTKTAA